MKQAINKRLIWWIYSEIKVDCQHLRREWKIGIFADYLDSFPADLVELQAGVAQGSLPSGSLLPLRLAGGGPAVRIEGVRERQVARIRSGPGGFRVGLHAVAGADEVAVAVDVVDPADRRPELGKRGPYRPPVFLRCIA